MPGKELAALLAICPEQPAYGEKHLCIDITVIVEYITTFNSCRKGAMTCSRT
jgi:hypothetical protein